MSKQFLMRRPKQRERMKGEPRVRSKDAWKELGGESSINKKKSPVGENRRKEKLERKDLRESKSNDQNNCKNKTH